MRTTEETGSETTPADQFFDRLGAVSAALVGFALPLSTSMGEICIGLFLVSFFLAPTFRRRLVSACTSPIGLAALAASAWILCAALYSTANGRDAWRAASKYREFLYFPLFLAAFRDQRLRTHALSAFVAGTSVMVFMSYFEVLTGLDLGEPSVWGYVVLKDRIHHALVACFALFVVAIEPATCGGKRWLQILFGGFTLFNLLFQVHARTGYMCLGLLALLLMWHWYRVRGVIVTALLLPILAGGAFIAIPGVRARVQETLPSVFGPAPQVANGPDVRFEIYATTTSVIRESPWLGKGMGSFAEQYRKHIPAQSEYAAPDAHNDYLMLTVQAGLIGLVLYLWFWMAVLRASVSAPSREQSLVYAVVLSVGIGGLVNSLLFGFTGGLLWAYFLGMGLSHLVAETDFATAPARKHSEDPALVSASN